MKRRIVLQAAGVAAVLAAGAPAAAADAAAAVDPGAGFVAVQDGRLVRRGRPYRVAGANLWYGAWLGAPSGGVRRARLSRELDRLQALGINNLRVLAVAEKTAMKSAVSPATVTAPGVYDEDLLRGLDVLMAEAARRDMTVVLYLNNFWQWSGGFTQYLNWFQGLPAHDPNVTKQYECFMDENARFYTDARAQDAYRRLIERIVGRRNTVTGQRYADDPALLSWQLANEPRPGSSKATPAQKAAYVEWIGVTATFIRTLDRRHLVSSGSEGLAGSARDARLFLDAHRTPDIGYLTCHLWPTNWGWFDPRRADATWAGMLDQSLEYLNAHVDHARTLGKPVVLEEFGLNRDGGAFDAGAPTTQRDRFYDTVFKTLEARAAAGDPVAGWNFWAWGGAGRAGHPDHWWRPGDDFIGDPPQEEQGLYAVFDSDASTLDVIAAAARRLQALTPGAAPSSP